MRPEEQGEKALRSVNKSRASGIVSKRRQASTALPESAAAMTLVCTAPPGERAFTPTPWQKTSHRWVGELERPCTVAGKPSLPRPPKETAQACGAPRPCSSLTCACEDEIEHEATAQSPEPLAAPHTLLIPFN